VLFIKIRENGGSLSQEGKIMLLNIGILNLRHPKGDVKYTVKYIELGRGLGWI